jgi:hypothetical protein
MHNRTIVTALLATVAIVSSAHAQPAVDLDDPPGTRAAAEPSVSADQAELAGVLTPPLPSVGSWSCAMGFPLEAAFGDSHALFGFGVSLDLSNRVTDRVYVGGSAELGLVLNARTDDDSPADPMLVRGRLGVDARFNFQDGTSTIMRRYAPAFELARRDWIGARAGLETLDFGSTIGQFAELSLGMDRQLGNTQVGPYISAGLSFEPARAYGGVNSFGSAPMMPTTDTPEVVATYVTVGWHLVFGA